MSFVPNAGTVSIDPAKLNYLLATNAGKAKFFARFGFDPSRPHELDVALRQRPGTEPLLQRVPHGAWGEVHCPVFDADAGPAQSMRPHGLDDRRWADGPAARDQLRRPITPAAVDSAGLRPLGLQQFRQPRVLTAKRRASSTVILFALAPCGVSSPYV